MFEQLKAKAKNFMNNFFFEISVFICWVMSHLFGED